jgi:hypothetical protein
MRPYDTIEKSPRNRQLNSEEEKAKNQDLFHTINARDDRCRMNMPMIDVPKEGVSFICASVINHDITKVMRQ